LHLLVIKCQIDSYKALASYQCVVPRLYEFLLSKQTNTNISILDVQSNATTTPNVITPTTDIVIIKKKRNCKKTIIEPKNKKSKKENDDIVEIGFTTRTTNQAPILPETWKINSTE
jgi:hypothetical protein